MEQVEQPTSEIKCDSPVELAEARGNVELTGIMEVQPSPQPDLNSAQILEDTTWIAAQEGESVSSDCVMSDLQEPGSASGEEVEGSEASDTTRIRVSPSRMNLKNGSGTEHDSPPQPNCKVSVTAQTFQGKSSSHVL